MTIAPNPSHLEAVNPGRRGVDACRADRPLERRRAPRPERRAPGPDPRRRRLRGPGRRRGDAQPAEPRGLLDRAARSTSSRTTRSASRPTRPRAARRAIRATSRRDSTSRSSTSTRTTPRRRWRRRARARVSRGVRPRLRHRPRGLPPLRAQRAGRGGVHPAAPGRADPAAADGARAVRRPARRRGRRHAEGAEAIVDEVDRDSSRGPRPVACIDRGATVTPSGAGLEPPGTGDAVETAVARERLRALERGSCLRVPEGFTVNPKLARQLERRRETMETGGIDWGQAEALAFASLLEDGIPIRLYRAGHRAGDVLAPPPRAPRPGDGRDGDADPAASRARTPRSRSTTRRSRSTRRSASSTATPSPRRTRSWSGRRSSATSSTARRS